jgi:hypothetical protein
MLVEYQHWPMEQVLIDDLNRCQWRTVTYSVQPQTDAEKLEISVITDVYSYRRVHRRASCSAGALCHGYGALTWNILPSTLMKNSWTLLNISTFPQHSQHSFRTFICHHKSGPYLSGISAAV